MKKELRYLDSLACLMVLVGYLIFTSPAHAHVQQGQALSFLTGLGHPWSGLDHALAMIAVGLWGAQLGNPAIWFLPISFPLVMSLGAMMGLLGIPLPGIEIGIAVSAIVLGVMVLGEVRLNLIMSVILVGCFAVLQGHAHGTELPAGQSGFLYSMGFVMATGCLHGIGISIGLIHRWPLGKLVLRGSGALIAVMGIFFLWQTIA